ncbi:helix-turn-helix domain-containing protein [Bradyrhizobium sp. USDA 3256]
MAGDPFTSAIFRWLNAVAADPTLPPAAFKLAYIISQHVNRTSHRAWPSQATLKEAVGVKDERSVRRLTDALEERGYLLTQRRKQTSMVYLLAQDRTELSYQGSENEAGPISRPDENDRSRDQDRTFDAPRPDIPVRQDRTNLSAKPLKEPLRNQEEGEAARATPIPDDFRLDDQNYNWALNRLGSVDAVDRSVFRLINNSRDKGTLSRDWQAKARNWIDRDAADRSSDRSVIAAADRLQAKIKSFDEGSSETEKAWSDVLSRYAKTGEWTRHVHQFGPDPSSPACRAPRHLLIKHGITREDAA